LQQVFELVARDEKKHTGLASLYLPTLLRGTGRLERLRLYRKQAQWASLVALSVIALRDDAIQFDVDLVAAAKSLYYSHMEIIRRMENAPGVLAVEHFDVMLDVLGRWYVDGRFVPRIPF
jgi:hypothetical protein